MFDSPPEMPQAVGDVVGRAFRACRQNISVIVRILLVPTIFQTIAGVVLQWVISYGVSQVAETKDVTTGVLVFFAGMLSLGVMMMASWISTIRLLALVRIQLGFSPDYASGLKNIAGKKWSIVGLYFIGTIILTFVTGFWLTIIVVSAIPAKTQPVITAVGGISGLWGLVVTFSIYVMVLYLGQAILACEERPLMSVIGRATQMTFRYFWRAMAFGGLLMLVYTVVSYPLSLPVVALTIFDMFRNGLMSPEGISETYKAPLYVMVINQVWESLMSLILRPVMLFGFGLFYYDLRLRGEGLDINRRLESFKQKALVGR